MLMSSDRNAHALRSFAPPHPPTDCKGQASPNIGSRGGPGKEKALVATRLSRAGEGGGGGRDRSTCAYVESHERKSRHTTSYSGLPGSLDLRFVRTHDTQVRG